VPPSFIPAVFQAGIPPGLPPGTWKAFVALAGPNALVDDTIDPGDLLAADMADFTIPSASAGSRAAHDD
ncbi:MAG: hypothetical protein ACREMB_12205, partial [Candidatus Rokuibacteriota bacterium]